MPNSLETIRQVHESLQKWLESVRKLPDPASQSSDILKQITQQLRTVDGALTQAAPAITVSQEWRDEIACYVETLREVRAQLANFEITLRIRQTQASDARSRLAAIRSWSDLTKNIG